jgi:flagellar hook-basal body complex protein FliE
MSDIRIDQINHLKDLFKPPREVGQPPGEEGGMAFGKIMKGIVNEAVEAESAATKAIQDFASGSIDNVHDVVMAVGKANMAIQLLVEVRNGVLEAYRELSRIQM